MHLYLRVTPPPLRESRTCKYVVVDLFYVCLFLLGPGVRKFRSSEKSMFSNEADSTSTSTCQSSLSHRKHVTDSFFVGTRSFIIYNIAEKSIFVASPSIWKKRINCIFCSFEIKKKKLVVLRWMWVRSSREAFLILMFQFIELTKCSSCLLVNRVCQKPRCKKTTTNRS